MEKTKVKETQGLITTLYGKITAWIASNKPEFLLLILILLLSAFLRLYRISEYMTFLGDEGRDVLIVRRLLVEHHPPLIGPGTSIGNMYLGPIYYYMMAIPLFLANYSPAGPAVMIAVLGIATVFFVWFVGREWFGKKAGLIASFFYAIAPVVIIYSRSSWNPNIMPFFALLFIYSVWRFWKFNELKWIIVAGVSFGFILQSHYLGLLLIPIFGIFWLIKLITTREEVNLKKRLVKYSLISLVFFLLLMSPLVIFDARHGWRNFSAIKTFFSDRQSTVSAKPWSAFPKFIPLAETVTARLLTGGDISGISVFVVLFAITIWLVVTKKKFSEKEKSAYFLIFLWLFFAFLGLGLYKQQIYDHYYGFFFVAPFLLLGALTSKIFEENAIFIKGATILGLLFLLYVNIKNNPLQYPPNRQLQRSIDVSQKIVEESGSQKFNFAVIAERNYEGAYQYFLVDWKSNLVIIDPQNTKDTITNQLFVACEMQVDKCDPTHNPKAEIANYGWSKIENTWNVDGVILYKLVHSK